MAVEGDVLWVMAGVLLGVKELAYMMIAHMSEGDYDRDHVSALCNDRDHVSAVICLGDTFVVKSGRRADTSPSVVPYEGDVAARRFLPARVTQQSRVEVSTRLQGILRRWRVLSERIGTQSMSWTVRKTHTWQDVRPKRKHPATFGHRPRGTG